MAFKGKVIGVLESVNKRGGETFSEEDVETLSILADQAAVAIQNAILFEQSDLVAEIVHEMRTPLTSIAGYAQILQREGISSEQHDTFLMTIQREAIRLGRLTNDFLELARLESGRAFLAQEEVDLGVVIDEAAKVLKPQAEGKGVVVQADIPSHLPTVIGDSSRFKQALINLIANGVKYSRKGDRVSVKAQVGDREVLIGVIDTGPGISQEAQDRLFQKFYRVPSSEDDAEGSGLGLAITRQIVEAAGGRIWVESEEGRGAAFHFVLPVAP
jgi:signal transduction histidine kinase